MGKCFQKMQGILQNAKEEAKGVYSIWEKGRLHVKRN